MFALKVLVLVNILIVQNISGQQAYRYDVIATSNASLTVQDAPSINNNGEVSFAARRIPGGKGIYIDDLPNPPLDLLPTFTSSPFWVTSPYTQINDSRQILSLWSAINTTPTQRFLRRIDGRQISVSTAVAIANGGFSDFDDIYEAGIAFNNNDRPVFQTRVGSFTTRLTSGVRPNFAIKTFASVGPIFQPVLSDNNTVVVRNGENGTDPIVTYDSLTLFLPTTIASSSGGFTQIGRSPSISKYDEAIAFYADLNQAGADALGTNPGPGIFVSVKLDNGQRRIIRLAGRLVENDPAPGGNNDGVCDPGETCIPGELGFNLAGNPIFFNSIDTNLRTDVAYIPSGKTGIEDDLVSISFVATPNIASDTPGRIFTNQTGIWTLTAEIKLDAGNVREKPKKADVVAQIGTAINGNTLTGISVYDQIANNVERVAFYANSPNGAMIIRAVRDPGTPVIFVAGIGGSTLLRTSDSQKLWLPPSLTSSLLDLNIDNAVKVPDVLRKDVISVPLYFDTEIVTYKPIIDYLKNSGYVEYNVDNDENKRNASCGGQADDPAQLNALRARHPTLFVFPYDWRRSIGDDTGAGRNVSKLRDYIDCVRRIYPNTQVNIVAHSLGGLLSRRYILENTASHNVKTLITIGSPWLGAPRSMHALETGSFMSTAFDAEDAGIGDIRWSSQIKELIDRFPGGHQLVPSQRYFDLGGNPLRVNGTNYNFEQTATWINERHSTSPATTSSNFHTVQQDDFRNATFSVNYYHIYGRQMHNRTVGSIEPRLRINGIPLGTYEQIYPSRTVGDGTVPLISASRRTDAGDGLNANCGTANDKRCIGVCYDYSAGEDKREKRSEHNGMTQNPQIHSHILQILKFTDGFLSTNPSFETDDCVLLPGLIPPSQKESHYVTMTGIVDVRVSDSQGRNNEPLGAYKRNVPGVLEEVIGPNSTQILTPVDDTYTMRFAGTGQSIAIEDIRGTTNRLSDASYIVRYDDVYLPKDRVAELKIVNNQVDSLKEDTNGDGVPDTVIPPSRVITNPSMEDLQPPEIVVSWFRPFNATQVTVNLSDTGSGVRRLIYRFRYGSSAGQFQTLNQSEFFSTLGLAETGIEIASEDNAGNRSDLVYYARP